jgi:DUF4097 and DUF4098 domain-containing protein YvlB
LSSGAHDRSSAFKGLLLIVIGGVFLIHHFHPEYGIGHVIRVYWPVLLILWGVAKLIDHMSASRGGGIRPAILSGGEAALLFLVVIVLAGFALGDKIQRGHPGIHISVDPFSEKFSDTMPVAPAKIPSGALLTVQTGLGSIHVHAGEVDEVRVSASQSASGHSESAARERMKDARVTLEKSGGGYLLHVMGQDSSHGGVSVDLDVQVPKTISLTASTPNGNISVSGVAGGVTATTEDGDVEIHEAGADVTVDMRRGDARISDVRGNLRITGRADELDVSDVAGDATLEGEFKGPIRLRNVAKTTHYTSRRADVTLLHLTGRLELDAGEIDIADVAGFAKITTQNKDIQAENVAGRIQIVDAHGDIVVHCSEPPREEINITNDSGGVDLTLPARSAFEISAVTRGGEVQSEFEDSSLKTVNDSESGRLTGRVGLRGPKINIVTSYGTINLRRSS